MARSVVASHHSLSLSAPAAAKQPADLSPRRGTRRRPALEALPETVYSPGAGGYPETVLQPGAGGYHETVRSPDAGGYH